MKIGLFLSALAACITLSASAAFATTHPKVAPLDEYFGRMKLSPLGIENIIHDTNLRVHYDPAHASQYYGTLATAEDALDDWARKYPADPWLPGRAYFMSHVFWQMHTPDATAAAEHCRHLLFAQFPKSHWAKVAKNETQALVAPAPVAQAVH
jgi:TolA-binding protein